MRVLKFGGSSVGTIASISQVKQIVESVSGPVVVVVSALGGFTDQLIRISQLAATADMSYLESVESARQRHIEMLRAVVPTNKTGEVEDHVEKLFGELKSILHGVCLIQDLTPKTADAIVAYGERLSSVICASLIEGSRWFDSRTFIKTTRQEGKHIVNLHETYALVRQTLGGVADRIVVGGFIASDIETGVTTNLGRGGSDYTASIIAAALKAQALEIWTDVDGFLTADPRIIPTA